MEAVEQQQLRNAQVPGLPTEGVAAGPAPLPPSSSAPSMPGGNIVIKRATFGDETSATDVTKNLTSQLEEYGYVDVTADNSLIPLVSWNGPKKVRLDEREQEYAQEKAEEECGGGQNKSCVEVRKQQQMALMLKEKENKTGAADKIVKGRRLTVTYVDEFGQEQTAVVPDGSQFKVGEPTKKEISPFTISSTLSNLLLAVFTLVGMFGWVYSVVATYRTFLEEGFRKLGYAATGVAIFFPYSGFFIMFGFFALKSIFSKNLPVQ
jgi:hypothetical protein